MTWSAKTTRLQKAVRTGLGESVTYTPTGGSGESITAPFWLAYESVSMQGDVVVASTGPACSVRIADCSQTPVAGDTITHSSTVYTVETAEPDGEGAVTLLLRR